MLMFSLSWSIGHQKAQDLLIPERRETFEENPGCLPGKNSDSKAVKQNPSRESPTELRQSS